MARGHRRTKTTWRTRPVSEGERGTWVQPKRDENEPRKRKPKKKQPEKRPRQPDESAWVWWWTIGRGGECHGCGNSVAKGEVVAFRAIDQALRCQVCVDQRSLTPRESRRYREAKEVAQSP
jgi:hypothetical protein